MIMNLNYIDIMYFLGHLSYCQQALPPNIHPQKLSVNPQLLNPSNLYAPCPPTAVCAL
jgi:hypothetical protein